MTKKLTDERTGTLLPPHDLAAERALLGSLFLFEEVLDDVALIVNAEDFYLASHQALYEAIHAVARKHNGHFDAVLVRDAVDRAKKLWPTFETDYVEILEGVPHGAGAPFYARIVAEKSTLRKISMLSTDAIREVHGPMPESKDVATGLVDRLLGVLERFTRSSVASMQDLMTAALNSLSEKRDPGIPTGYAGLDALLNGLQPGNLLILAARPSMGKTAFVIDLACQIAKGGHPVLFFSLEQSKIEVSDRLLSRQSGLACSRLRHVSGLSEHSCQEIMAAAEILDQLPIFVSDQQGQTISELEAGARIVKRKQTDGKLGVVLIDYLQLVEPEDRREPREQQVASCTRRLKSLARALGVPVICLAQLNRELEKRDDKRPRLSDLRESGAIEQDADVVLLLHRPEYYKVEDQPGVAELIVAKHRNGPKGTVKLHFDKACMTFAAMSRDELASAEQQAVMAFQDQPHIERGDYA